VIEFNGKDLKDHSCVFDGTRSAGTGPGWNNQVVLIRYVREHLSHPPTYSNIRSLNVMFAMLWH
jgi:hypothetical protein